MTCPSFVGLGWLCLALAVYWARDTIWHIVVALGIAVAATAGMVAVTGLVLASAAIVRWVRRRQQAAGACVTCAHPCKSVHVQSADPAPVKLVALPMPAVRPAGLLACDSNPSERMAAQPRKPWQPQR